MPQPERVLLGIIATAHGIRGEVIVKSYCNVPEAIASYGPLYDESGARTFTFKIRGATKRGLIARIAGIEDRNAAELLRGTQLYVDRDKLPEPEDDEYYHEDLIGLTAIEPDGTAIGEVIAVQNFGAGDLLEVRLQGGRRTEFFPFEERFVPDIDVDAGTLTIAIDPSDDPPPEPEAAGEN